jgi:hypothetical protein
MSERESSTSCVMCRLNRNARAPAKILPYRHKGIFINIAVRAGECEQCAIARHRGVFERVEEAVRLGVLKTPDDRWQIDWGLFNHARVYPEMYEPNFYLRLVNLLIDIGILAFIARSGLFMIIDDWSGKIHNPRASDGFVLHFVRFEDASRYGKTCWLKDAQRPWSIVEMGKVVMQKDVIK